MVLINVNIFNIIEQDRKKMGSAYKERTGFFLLSKKKWIPSYERSRVINISHNNLFRNRPYLNKFKLSIESKSSSHTGNLLQFVSFLSYFVEGAS